MSESSVVSAGDDVLASQYNNLRKDVLDTSLGHTHDGTDSKSIAVDDSTLELSGAGGTYRVKDLGITSGKLGLAAVVANRLHVSCAGDGLVQAGSGALDVNPDDSTLEINSDVLRVKALGIAGSHLASGAVIANKMGSGASYSSAQTRYKSISGISAITDFGSVANLVFGDHGAPLNLVSLRSDSDTNPADGWIPLELPHGAIITSFKAYMERTDAAASASMNLYRTDMFTVDTMASIASTISDGGKYEEDTSINNATIDNSTYIYYMDISIDPNDDAEEVGVGTIIITYTVTLPLP